MSILQSEQALARIPTGTEHHLYLFVDGRQLPLYDQNYFPDEPIVESAVIYLYESDEEQSPYLLIVNDVVKQWFLRHQRGVEGFFFSSSWSIETLAEHFRQQIQVLSPYGTTSYLNMAHADVAWTLVSVSCHWFWLPIALQRLLEAIYHHMKRHFPEVLFQQERGDLWVEAHAQIARQKGFVTRQDQLNYFNIIGWLGESAVAGEVYPEIYQLIHFPSPERTPTQRIRQAARCAKQYALGM